VNERLRLLADGDYALTVVTVDEDGGAVDVTAPSLVIHDGAGESCGGTFTPTPHTGSLTCSVPAATLPTLDTYTLVWSGTVGTASWEAVQRVETVGGFLCGIAEFRAFAPEFADATRYPAARVRAARTVAEERFERACRVAFVPRGRRVRTTGDGSVRLRVDDNALRRLLSATIDGVALAGDEIAAVAVREWGAFDRPPGRVWPDGAPVALHYEHGYDAPPPEVVQAVMLLMREYMAPSILPARATSLATDIGNFRITVAGRDGSTGVPEVDAVIANHSRRRPRIG